MSSAVAPEEQLEWEARAGKPAGAAAIAAAVLLLLSAFYGPLWGHSGTQYAGQFLQYDKHPADVFIPYAFQAISDLLLVIPVLYLIRVIRPRSETFSPALSYIAIAGPPLAAVVVTVQMFAINGVAGDFAATKTPLTPAPALVAQAAPTTGSAVGVYSAVREKAEVKAYQMLKDDSLSKSTAFTALAVSLAFGFALIFISLNSMRVGLFSRVIGIFGIIVGVLAVLFQGAGILEAFWLGAVGVLILGFWPSGRGPAWDSVESIPWPSAMQARQDQMEAARAARGEAPEPDVEDDYEDDGDEYEDDDDDVVDERGDPARREPLALSRPQAQAQTTPLVDVADGGDRRDRLRQPLQLERLLDVGVGSDAEGVRAVGAAGAGGQHDDRHGDRLGRGAQLLGQLVAVHARHHDVDDRQVGRLLARQDERLVAVGREQHLVAEALQVGRDQIADVGRVVHDEDAQAAAGQLFGGIEGHRLHSR